MSQRPSSGPSRFSAAIIGAAAGVALTVIAIAALWFSGTLPQSAAVPGTDRARLDRIETQLRDLSARPGGDTKSADDLSARLGKIEAALASRASDPALADRLAAAEGASKSAADDLNTLRARLDDIAGAARVAQSRADVAIGAADAAQKAHSNSPEQDALAGRVAALETAAKSADAGDRASRLAIVASALSSAVERGEPFAAELAAARSQSDPKAFAALEPFAANGVPPVSALARELSALVPAMSNAIGGTTGQGGVLEKLQANAEKLVRIRPVGDVPGDEPSAILARVEFKAARSDIAGALEDLAKLPPAVRAPAESWIKTAQARNAAVSASRQFAREALAALGKPAP